MHKKSTATRVGDSVRIEVELDDYKAEIVLTRETLQAGVMVLAEAMFRDLATRILKISPTHLASDIHQALLDAGWTFDYPDYSKDDYSRMIEDVEKEMEANDA